MSWAAHEFENYFIQRHLGTRASFLAIVVGALSPDLFTKAFVYASQDPPRFHRSWPGAGVTHSLLFGVLLGVARASAPPFGAGPPAPLPRPVLLRCGADDVVVPVRATGGQGTVPALVGRAAIRRRYRPVRCGHARGAGAHRHRRRPTVVVGDFNATERDPLFEVLRAAGLRSALASVTVGSAHRFTGRVDGPRIDHILVSRHWHVEEAAVVAEPALRPLPSDHWPVVARLRELPEG